MRLNFDQEIAESSAFALDRRNFDYLPDEQAAHWRAAFLRVRADLAQGPTKLILELLNSCNFDCPMCRVGEHGIDLSRKMSLSVFDSILKSLPSVKTVRLNGLGETTLLADLKEYLSILQRQRVRLEVISNGSGPLSDYAAVIDADGHVLVSCDAVQPALFEKLRRPARWAAIEERLGEIANLVQSLGRGRCSLIFTQQKANIGELRNVTEFAVKLGLSAVQMNVAKTPNTHWIAENIDSISIDVADATQIATAGSMDLFTPARIAGLELQCGSQTHVASLGCRAPWEEVVIRWNGDVQPCNMFNPYIYGNIHRHRLKQIWSNAFAEVFRQKLNSPDRHPYCVGCVYMPAAYT